MVEESTSSVPVPLLCLTSKICAEHYWQHPQQGGKKQGLKAPPQRLLAVMQQREVIVGLGALMGLDGLSELGDNRAKGIVLIEPMGKEMHAHT